ncbi:MAG: 50S ribosomal protein L28 [Bacteroidota bacterium]
MPRVCEITGKRTIFGNNVSHANNKTRRKFQVNLQKKKFYIEELNAWIPLCISTGALRTIQKNGMLPTLKKAYQAGTLSAKLRSLVIALPRFNITKK